MREALGGEWRTTVSKCVPRQRTTRPQGLAQGFAQELTLAQASVAPWWPQALVQGATSARGNSVRATAHRGPVWHRNLKTNILDGERFVFLLLLLTLILPRGMAVS